MVFDVSDDVRQDFPVMDGARLVGVLTGRPTAGPRHAGSNIEVKEAHLAERPLIRRHWPGGP